jgi:quercetin dioxygenase-like cupin family protein
MTNLEELHGLAPKHIWDGVSARVVEGERITLAIVELEPGAVVPVHQHDNEQLGFVIEGTVTFTIGDETKELGPGGTWRIVGGTPHTVAVGSSGAVVVDVFTPTRDDWRALETEPPRTPRWPS